MEVENTLPFEEDEFIIWRENPITRYIFDTVLSMGEKEAKDYWIAQAWDAGNLDPILHMNCHARAKLARELITLTYEDLVAANNAISAK